MTTRTNLYVDQGVDFEITLDLFTIQDEEFDITNQTFICYARKMYSSSNSLEIQVNINTIDNDSNNLDLLISAEHTRILPPGKYQYDLIMITSGNRIIKILEGLLFILPTMSRVPSP